MTEQKRYQRFERVTVRAAARLLRGSRAALIAASELKYYLRELVMLDAHATPAGGGSLRRLALSRSPRGEAGTREGPAATGRRGMERRDNDIPYPGKDGCVPAARAHSPVHSARAWAP